MAKKALPCPTVLRQLLRYEPETGKLFWRKRGPEWFLNTEFFSARCQASRWNKKHAGCEAFTTNINGYRRGIIRLFGQNKIFAHRAAWAIYYGFWPDGDIDHIDGVRFNNRIGNLRDVTRSENLKNRIVSSNNGSGVMGVSWHKGSQKWRAFIGVGGRRQMHLGTFDTKAGAITARKSAEAELNYHENHGRNQHGE